KSYGTFFLQSKSSIISRVELPTTEIIEPSFIPFYFYINQTALIKRNEAGSCSKPLPHFTF
ncbi:hypothetical protein DDV22_09045, partial [Streptococcus chenjunshii]